MPAVLPRHDDICVVILKLANQRGLISYRRPDGPEALSTSVNRTEGRKALLPPPNVASAYGPGPAYADLELLPVLESLGLVHDGHWTALAETILWRVDPPEWELRFVADPRFAAAVDQSSAIVPRDIAAELAKLANRMRLNRSGNRQANAALYRVAIVRMRDDETTKAYAARRTAEGKTRRDIVRCVKRYIVREIYRHLCVPLPERQAP